MNTIEKTKMWNEVQNGFLEILDQKDQIPNPVILRALSDERYMSYLYNCRNDEQLFELLLQDSKNHHYQKLEINSQIFNRANMFLQKWNEKLKTSNQLLGEHKNRITENYESENQIQDDNFLTNNTSAYHSEKEVIKELNQDSNIGLLKKAGKALVNWGKNGFILLDDEAIERRENACLSCIYLADPVRVLQKMIPSKNANEKIGERTGKKVCKLCGCNVGKKILLPSESCPDIHPEKPEMNRWGEPIS
jgi:hypothetical protein